MSSMERTLEMLSRRTDLLFAFFFLIVVSMLIMPLPTLMVDAMIGFNLAFSFIILVTTLYLRSALELSTFPAIILIGTVFRLALTISTTRLILAEADAGEIIKAFGSFVVGGNLIVGLVVFLIVALVQFIVVTKGAERIAEVGARFTLDAMPGKQLAIDSDLRNGHISPEAARIKRDKLEQESQFFGAMDGAMRFVKGDAIAALVVVAVNLIGGLAIGIFQKGLSFSDAANLYSLLSIGDGLVAQVPSMLMAVAAGTVVTRVTAEESKSLGSDIGSQIARDPRALGVGAVMVLAIGFVPGFPIAVLWPIAALLATIAFYVYRKKTQGSNPTNTQSRSSASQEHTPLDPSKYGDPVIATLSPTTFERLEESGFGEILEQRMREIARIIGVAVTVPTFNADLRIADDIIHIQVENVPAATVYCEPEKALDFVANEIARVVRRHAGMLFSLDDVTQWLDGLKSRLGRLPSEVSEQVPPMRLVSVLRLLLDSGVSLSQPRSVLETVLDSNSVHLDVGELAERARRSLGKQIAFSLIDQEGHLAIISLGASWEDAVVRYRDNDNQYEAEQALEDIRNFIRRIDEMLLDANRQDRDPVVLLEPSIRLLSQNLLLQYNCRIPVLGYDDVDDDISIDVIGTIDSGQQHLEAAE